MRIAVHDYAGHPFQFELSRALASRGHVVRHFFFADDPGPKGASVVTADDPPSFSVEPISLKMQYRKDKFVRRALGDYLYGQSAYRRIKAFHPEIVISGNTPLDAQRAIKRAAARSGGKFVFWVQDFYGIAIERLVAGRWRGLGSLIAKYYRTMEARLLQTSDAVVLISPDFIQYLPHSMAKSGIVHVIRNWGALKTITPQDRSNNWAMRQGLTGKFVFMYTGTLALKHDPGLLLQICDTFGGDEQVEVVVVAAGVNAEKLKLLNEAKPRKNLRILPLQSAEDFPNVLGTADVLVALLESDAAEFSVPSKLLSYLCAGRPIILSAPGKNLATQVLNESQGGIAVEALETSDLIAAARQLRQEPATCQHMANAGRQYAQQHFEIENIADHFEQVFRSTGANRSQEAGMTGENVPLEVTPAISLCALIHQPDTSS